ncbi:ABC transporter substrate-binding protein [Salinigranum salinum]|uniref:ABC transporter substrate-binding protein n=1 Tax=Salinigranum salinum TaxID=1364937 RepID=UPI0012604FA5|nr:ABC transporter substrate-binding protein [Salinigranum salinum]
MKRPYEDLDRRTVLELLGVAGTVGLAGCTGGGGDGGDGGGDGGDGGDGSSGDGGGGSSGDGGDGDGDGSGGSDGDGGSMSGTVTIGLQGDMTGPLSTYGFWFERTLTNYVEELNADGGINGMDVELVVEDTATDGKQGATAFRKLVQQKDADFVVGSFSSGVNLATTPLARQLQTPYFPSGSAPSTTGEDGNRWIVRTAHEIKQNASLGVRWGLDNLGSQWTVIYQDYAFGQQWLAAIKEFIDGEGEVIEEIPVPIGTTDLNSYLNNVPDETEVLFSALILPSSINFLQQTADLGVPGERLGDISSIEGVNVTDIQDAGEGATFLTGLPPSLDTEGNNHLRELAAVDDADQNLVRQYWVAYEALSFIKMAVEESGWASADDNQAFIEWFESGPSVDEGVDFPQGDKFIRGADHQAFMDRYMTRITDGDLEVITELELDEPPTAPAADFTSQSF